MMTWQGVVWKGSPGLGSGGVVSDPGGVGGGAVAWASTPPSLRPLMGLLLAVSGFLASGMLSAPALWIGYQITMQLS